MSDNLLKLFSSFRKKGMTFLTCVCLLACGQGAMIWSAQVSWSPDKNWVVSVEEEEAAEEEPTLGVKLYKVMSKNEDHKDLLSVPMAVQENSLGIGFLGFAHKNNMFFFYGQDDKRDLYKVWIYACPPDSSSKPQMLATYSFGKEIEDVQWSPDDNFIAFRGNKEVRVLFSPQAKERLFAGISRNSSPPLSTCIVDLIQDFVGQDFLSQSVLFHHECKKHNHSIHAMAWSPALRGNYLAFAGSCENFGIWSPHIDTKNLSQSNTVFESIFGGKGHIGRVQNIGWTQDGYHLMSIDVRSNLCIWRFIPSEYKLVFVRKWNAFEKLIEPNLKDRKSEGYYNSDVHILNGWVYVGNALKICLFSMEELIDKAKTEDACVPKPLDLAYKGEKKGEGIYPLDLFISPSGSLAIATELMDDKEEEDVYRLRVWNLKDPSSQIIYTGPEIIDLGYDLTEGEIAVLDIEEHLSVYPVPQQKALGLK